MDRPERDQKIRLPQPLRHVIFLAASLLLSGCVAIPAAQLRVRTAAESGEYAVAEKLLEDSRKDYGARSSYLYLLEKGLLLHFEGNYGASVDAFEQARRRYEELYTKSLSGIASSLVLTDYSMDYRGEDFERILLNVFQSLNYVMLGEYDEARVEARDADSRLAIINSKYPEKQKNVYREDAFCRMLMGLLYEASHRPQDADDACLWFKQALRTYEGDYRSQYGAIPPAFLKEKNASCPSPVPVEKRPAEVYVIQYQGFSPLKEEVMVPVPLLNGYVTQIAFPRYYQRPSLIASAQLLAKNDKGAAFIGLAEAGEDIGAIARKNLDDRKVRAIALATVKAAVKYAAVASQERSVAKHNDRGGLDIYRLLSSLYFLSTNRADLRSWQTLPEKITVTRLALDSGDYTLEFSSLDRAGAIAQRVILGKAHLVPGEKKFYIVRTPL